VQHLVLSTSLGPVGLFASDEGLTRIEFLDEIPSSQPGARGSAAGFEGAVLSPLLAKAARQLLDYLAGHARAITLPLALQGTPFQRAVWREICEIPYGETASYGELARRLGSIRKCRAVGGAAGANPLPLCIPCHRVIGADGALTGFSAGLERKQFLLALERRVMDADGNNKKHKV